MTVTTTWRATGPYLPTNASKAGLLDETRQFLLTYAEIQDSNATARRLIDGGLPQRSRETRTTVIKVIKTRIVNWDPPGWVIDDLVIFASEPSSEALKAALLLHAARQDVLLYAVVQHVIAPLWEEGLREVSRADVQAFLDQAVAAHPEIDRWSRETREKLAGNLLSILRDYGLLVGTARKQISEPVVPSIVVAHLARLLLDEGVTSGELAHHPDWRLWLWDASRAARALQNTEVLKLQAGA